MSLIDPINTIEDAETKELVKFFNETLGFCPNSVLTMQKNPALAKAFINLNMAVMERTTPPQADRISDKDFYLNGVASHGEEDPLVEFKSPRFKFNKRPASRTGSNNPSRSVNPLMP